MMSELDTPASSSAAEPRGADEPKDLGFGSIVGGANEKRLLNRDGSFTARREGRSRLGYLNGYHALLTISWPRFLGIVCGAYLTVNALFALAFLAGGSDALGGMPDGSMGGHYLKAFFFSVETFATIGYGHVYPVGAYANWLVTIEAVVGLLAAALLTGLVFARFARPTAAVLFSDVAVVGPYLGKTAFMFRITNARSNQLVELEAKVLFSRLDGTGRRWDQLKLERTRVTFFPLSWTIVHPIDEQSPLWGCTHYDLVDRDAEFLILLSGTDETFSQMVHARSSYKPDEILFGKKFANIYNPVGEDGTISIDILRLSEVQDAPVDENDYRFTQTYRHTGHFTGFAPPRTSDKTRPK